MSGSGLAYKYDEKQVRLKVRRANHKAFRKALGDKTAMSEAGEELSNAYAKALRAAGAEVHHFRSFGSYQGEWWAQITYKDETGWVTGSYGSCSGCDAFEGEFGWSSENVPDYQSKLADFGRTYCETVLPFGHYLIDMLNKAQYDSETEASLRWMAEIEKVKIDEELALANSEGK